MTLEQSEETLLEKTREEERAYNWLDAVKLYKQAVNFYMDKKLLEKAAENNKNLGYAHSRAVDTVDTAEEYINQIKCAVEAYKEATNLFKQLGNRSIELECEAEMFFTSGFLATSDAGGQKAYRQAIKLFSESAIKLFSEYGRIVIVICRDFLDMDLRVELKNFEPPIDIILNPAFTPVTADFKAAHFDARRSIYAYSFFANIGEFGESLIYTPEKDRTERIIPAKKEDIIYKDINLFKLRSERKKWEKEQTKERLFIQSTR